MPELIETDVLIVGAGPVGLTLAIDLAWRGIAVTVVETRAPAPPAEPKCNHVAARPMEIFRRRALPPRRSRNAITSPLAPWKFFGGWVLPTRSAMPDCRRITPTTSAIAL